MNLVANGVLEFGTPGQPAVFVPVVAVTMRQARLALLATGKLAAVEMAIDAMSEPERTQARIAWDYSSVLERSHPLVTALGPAIGLNDVQVDALFATAAGIP